MPGPGITHILGQYSSREIDLAALAARIAVGQYRDDHGLGSSHFPAVQVGRRNSEGYTSIYLVTAGYRGAAPLAPAPFSHTLDAINAALQQNRSTMTKPIPTTLGEIELELAAIEVRQAKRMRTTRALDERTQRLRAAADKLRYPSEPQVETIRFRKQFLHGGKVYTYAAQRTPQGRWFATGQGHPGAGRSWKVLIDFIREDNVLLNREPLFVELGLSEPF